ncbi:MAG TPA: SCO family protein [Planctomycetota bacterium]|nr:SCO family protein [Planctomycetota bacterium]
MKPAAILLASGLTLSALIVAARWSAHLESAPRPEPDREATRSIPSEAPGPAPLKPGEPIPDAELVTQDGRPVHLADFRGQTLVLAFIYTRCNMSTMCPMAVRKLREAQTCARKENLNPHFLVVSFDPEDSPEVLRDYARRNEVDLSNWDFATGSPEVVGPLAHRFSTYFRPLPGGAYEHNLNVTIVDARGNYHDEFFGTEWGSEEFLRTIREVNP